MQRLNESYSDANHRYLKTAHALEIITHYRRRRRPVLGLLPRAIETVPRQGRACAVDPTSTAQVRASVSQRNRVLEDCLATYAEFRRQLGAWTLGYPQHLDLEQVTAFLDNLDKVEAFARNAIKTSTFSPTPTEGRTGKQLFETEDNQLLIGDRQYRRRDPAKALHHRRGRWPYGNLAAPLQR